MILASAISGLSGQAIALLAGAVGALIGTSIGILSVVWACRSEGNERSAEGQLNGAIRLVSDELLRLAAGMERCVGELGPARGLEVVRAADLEPPLRAWQANQATLAGGLPEEAWRKVAIVPAEWALVYEEMRAAAAANGHWSGRLRRAMISLQSEAIEARQAIGQASDASPLATPRRHAS